MSRLLALLLGLATLATPAAARDDGHFRQLASGEPMTLRADRGYVLLRVKKSSHAGWISPGFLRVPTEAEVTAFDALRRAAHAKAGKRAGPYEELPSNTRISAISTGSTWGAMSPRAIRCAPSCST